MATNLDPLDSFAWMKDGPIPPVDPADLKRRSACRTTPRTKRAPLASITTSEYAALEQMSGPYGIGCCGSKRCK
jgi:hypothetical protein